MSELGREPRESVGCTVGITLGLLGLAFLVAAPFLLLRGRALGVEEREALVARHFAGGRAPFGLELVEASALSDGVRVLRFAAPPSDGRERGRDPDELVLVLARKPDRVRRLLEVETTPAEEAGEKLARWPEVADEAWTTALDGGELVWDEWRADFLMQRSFREGGGFRDGAVVDLSLSGEPRALVVLWPPGVEGHRDAVLRAVRAVRTSPADALPAH